MTWVDVVGSIAALLTTIAFVPQAWRAIRTRNTRDISLAMYVVFSLGVVFWLLYGVLIGSLPIVIANIITLALSVAILAMKYRYG